MRSHLLRALPIALVAAVCFAWPVAGFAAPALTPIAANDNRTPAGELRNGVLTLRLEMRKGIWHPERDDGEAIPVYAFGEAGKPLQVPAPTIRVPRGTTIDISLHSELTVPATLHGLHERPGDDHDVVILAPGASTHLRFMAGAPGTYLYWARTAINGKSWPFTERLHYTVGDHVHWRIVNASDLSHPMHLHGRPEFDTSKGWTPDRRLQLTVGSDKKDARFYELALRDLSPSAANQKPQLSTGLNGPPIVLTQHQRVEIDVVNHLKRHAVLTLIVSAPSTN